MPQALEVPLAHPIGDCQLVGVTGDAGRGQGVDVGEHQLGEQHDLVRGQPGLDGGAGQAAPRHPGAHPVGGQQRVHGPPAPRLRLPERERALKGGRQRGAGVLVGGGQGEEPAQGQLDGLGQHRLGRLVEGPAVAGHLLGHGVDGLLGHVVQAPLEGHQHRPRQARAWLLRQWSPARHHGSLVRGEQIPGRDSPNMATRLPPMRGRMGACRYRPLPFETGSCVCSVL